VTSTIWLAYVEEHALTDPYRRAAGRAKRLGGIPNAVLPEPQDVVNWLVASRAAYAKHADEHGRALNALVDERDAISARLTERGGSVYATVRQSRTMTVDLCVEAVEEPRDQVQGSAARSAQ
jgi:hypothetical protein